MIRTILLFMSMLVSSSIFAQDWQFIDVVDEFGDPTGARTLTYSFEGTFSNSATNGSQCTGYIRIDNDESVGIVLLDSY